MSIVAIFACVCLIGIVVPHRRRVHVAELPRDLELLDSVFWEPGDTDSLRELISTSPKLISGKSVLDIGTGSGLVALCCCQFGAAEVTATDVNPAAIECAQRNAKRMGFQIDTKLVPVDGKHTSAFSVFDSTKRFDLIVSNPPWEDGKPKQWSDYALYDPEFQLLDSIMREGKSRLNPGGKILLAYGCVDAIRHVNRLAEELQYDVVVFDDRDLDGLPPLFLPGMLLGLVPKAL